MEFVATECGFVDGMGGASNAMDAIPQHYVLFGHQVDNQHPEYSGVYFEFDDQIHGAANCISSITISEGRVEFVLKKFEKIIVKCGMEESKWEEFLKGIQTTFDPALIKYIPL